MKVISFHEFKEKRLKESSVSPVLEEKLEFAFDESTAFIRRMIENKIENFMLSLEIEGKEFILTLDYKGGGDFHA